MIAFLASQGLPAGTMIDGWKVLKRLGSGGFGAVHQVEKNCRLYALKLAAPAPRASMGAAPGRKRWRNPSRRRGAGPGPLRPTRRSGRPAATTTTRCPARRSDAAVARSRKERAEPTRRAFLRPKE